MLLTVHIHPKSSKNAIKWIDKDTVETWVTAAPEKNKANQALLELLSQELGVAKSQLEIVRGSKTKIKQIEIKNWRN
jgi:uncharacterized protein (TIGR00251 family)